MISVIDSQQRGHCEKELNYTDNDNEGDRHYVWALALYN